jgi:hypothetical protein
MEVAKNKEENMEKIPWPTMQSMVKEIQFSIKLELQKHLEMNSRMEVVME